MQRSLLPTTFNIIVFHANSMTSTPPIANNKSLLIYNMESLVNYVAQLHTWSNWLRRRARGWDQHCSDIARHSRTDADSGRWRSSFPVVDDAAGSCTRDRRSNVAQSPSSHSHHCAKTQQRRLLTV